MIDKTDYLAPNKGFQQNMKKIMSYHQIYHIFPLAALENLGEGAYSYY